MVKRVCIHIDLVESLLSKHLPGETVLANDFGSDEAVVADSR